MQLKIKSTEDYLFMGLGHNYSPFKKKETALVVLGSSNFSREMQGFMEHVV